VASIGSTVDFIPNCSGSVDTPCENNVLCVV